jgi:hypothetical protein
VALGGTTEGREDRSVAVEIHRIIAPMPRRDHAAVEVKDALELEPVEADLRSLPFGKRYDSGAGTA